MKILSIQILQREKLKFEWSVNGQHAFEQIKEKFSIAMALALLTDEAHFDFYTDADYVRTSRILFQEHKRNNYKILSPVFLSVKR